MMRSKEINDPWYNNYYSTQISEVTRFDDHTLAITSGTEKSREDLLESPAVQPEPSHAIKLTSDWVKSFNWKVLPVTGAYQIGELKKGKSVTFNRVKDWWGTMSATSSTASTRIASRSRCSGTRTSPGSTSCAASWIPSPDHAQLVATRARRANSRRAISSDSGSTTRRPSPHGTLTQHRRPLLSSLDVRLGIQHALAFDKMLATCCGGLPAPQHLWFWARGPSPTPTSRHAPSTQSWRGNASPRRASPKPGRTGSCQNDKGQPLSPHHLHHGGARPAPDPAAGRGEEGGAQSGAEPDGCLSRLQIHAGEETPERLDGLERWPLPPAYWEFFHRVNANKPQTNNIMNLDDEALSALVEQYDKAFDFGKKAELSRQIQQRLYGLASFVPAYQVPYTRAAPGAGVRLPKGAGDAPGDCSTGPWTGATAATTSAACSGSTKRRRRRPGPPSSQARPLPAVTLIDTTYQQK